MMANVNAKSGMKQLSIEVSAIYPACLHCKRPNPEFAATCVGCGKPTPKPLSRDRKGKPLGVVMFWHRNCFKRWAWWLGRKFKETTSWLTA